MRRSAMVIAAQPSLTDRRIRPSRVTVNGSGTWLKRQRRNSIEPRRDTLHPMAILNALEQTQAVVGIVDGRIVHWSRGAERLYGWAANEALGCRAGDLLKEKGADGSGASEIPHDEVWKGELIRRHKDGRELLISAQRVLGRDDGNRATVIELDRLIEPADRAVYPPARPTEQTEGSGCPTHRTAHEIKNLLGVIALNLELARECAANGGELRKMIDEALAAAWQGSELTSRVAGSAGHRPV